MASTVQLYITLPSTIIVQAPHVPRSHTRLAAVSSSRCRSVSSSVARGSTLVLYGLPLICSVIGTSPGPETLAVCASVGVSRTPVVRTPLVTPTPCKKPRREKLDLRLRFSGSCFRLTGHLPLGRNLIDVNKTSTTILWRIFWLLGYSVGRLFGSAQTPDPTILAIKKASTIRETTAYIQSRSRAKPAAQVSTRNTGVAMRTKRPS